MKRHSARLLVRHQAAAFAATAVDFATMIVLVDALDQPTSRATLLGAIAGAVVNFSLGRAWAFSARRGNLTSQAARYAVVSAGSAALNALGVFLLAPSGASHAYVLVRLLVSFAVSLLWNFPMQRGFVFRERAESRV